MLALPEHSLGGLHVVQVSIRHYGVHEVDRKKILVRKLNTQKQDQTKWAQGRRYGERNIAPLCLSIVIVFSLSVQKETEAQSQQYLVVNTNVAKGTGLFWPKKRREEKRDKKDIVGQADTNSSLHLFSFFFSSHSLISLIPLD